MVGSLAELETGGWRQGVGFWGLLGEETDAIGMGQREDEGVGVGVTVVRVGVCVGVAVQVRVV